MNGNWDFEHLYTLNKFSPTSSRTTIAISNRKIIMIQWVTYTAWTCFIYIQESEDRYLELDLRNDLSGKSRCKIFVHIPNKTKHINPLPSDSPIYVKLLNRECWPWIWGSTLVNNFNIQYGYPNTLKFSFITRTNKTEIIQRHCNFGHWLTSLIMSGLCMAT